MGEKGRDKTALEEELAYLEDAEQEVMLSSEESDVFLVRLGSTYIKVGEEEFNEYLEKKRSGYEERLGKVAEACEALESEKSELKAELYARFGNTINLDD